MQFFSTIDIPKTVLSAAQCEYNDTHKRFDFHEDEWKHKCEPPMPDTRAIRQVLKAAHQLVQDACTESVDATVEILEAHVKRRRRALQEKKIRDEEEEKMWAEQEALVEARVRDRLNVEPEEVEESASDECDE